MKYDITRIQKDAPKIFINGSPRYVLINLSGEAAVANYNPATDEFIGFNLTDADRDIINSYRSQEATQ